MEFIAKETGGKLGRLSDAFEGKVAGREENEDTNDEADTGGEEDAVVVGEL